LSASTVSSRPRRLEGPSPSATATIASWRLSYVAFAFPMVVAAFGSLPRRVDLGPVSGMGALTVVEVGLAAAALIACRGFSKRLLLRLSPYLAFLVWMSLTVVWARPGIEGAQNALVYILFGELAVLAGALSSREPERVERLIDLGTWWISVVALGLVALDLAAHGLPGDAEDSWWVGPRPVAILGLVTMSRFLAKWYYGDRWSRLWIVLWICAVVVSISRMATAVALGLVSLILLAQIRFRRRRVAITLPAAMTAMLVVLALVFLWKPFYDRMFSGDVAMKVGGESINVSGRMQMWKAIIHSALQAPVIGQGLGSAEQVVALAFADTRGRMAQPHDDYLRVWHDLGAIGLTLYLLAVLGWTVALGRQWYFAERGRLRVASVEFAGLLVIVALSLVEVTDNPIVYQSVMGMAGLIIGAGLGIRALPQARGATSISAPHPALTALSGD
jgi:O-antigen ligase